MVKGKIVDDLESYRCSDEPDDCIADDYVIDEDAGISQYKHFFTKDSWKDIKKDIRSGDIDPEELRCGAGKLDCIPLKYTTDPERA